MNNKKYDLVVYGASGFTGQLICEYLSNHKDTVSLNWAIAGRNTSKLEMISNQFSTENKKINVLYADSFDKASLDDICSQSQLIISTVGPYAIYGEQLISSCINNHTYYLTKHLLRLIKLRFPFHLIREEGYPTQHIFCILAY